MGFGEVIEELGGSFNILLEHGHFAVGEAVEEGVLDEECDGESRTDQHVEITTTLTKIIVLKVRKYDILFK